MLSRPHGVERQVQLHRGGYRMMNQDTSSRSRCPLCAILVGLDPMENPKGAVLRISARARSLPGDVWLSRVRAVEVLDQPCYIFVGFYRGSYCVNLCDRIRDRQSQKYTVGSNDKWFYFEEFNGLWKFLRPLIRKPLRAWLY